MPASNPSLENLSDPKWRLANLYKITDKNARLEIFKPNSVQKKIQESQAKRKITLKARQFGITTEAVLRRFDSCIWNKNRTVCILAHKQGVLDKIFRIVKTAYRNLPDNLRPVLDRGGGGMYEYRFPEQNSIIYTTLEVRGGTIHELHVSEAAFIPKERIDATLQAVPLDGIVEFESTPNGLNHFYDLWGESEDGYERFFFPWFFHAEYRIPVGVPLTLSDDEQRLTAFALSRFNIRLSHEQINFRRYKIKELGYRIFQQEYPEDDQSCFLASGSNPFDTAKLKAKLQALPPGPPDVANGICIYEPYDKTKSYVIGADPAEGVRSDNSAACVVCVQDKREVASFAGQHGPSEFADKLYALGKLYSHAHKWPLLAIERNNHGHAVILKLHEVLNYPNLWKAPDEKIGHHTNLVTRPLLLDTFIEAVDSGTFTLRTKELFAECLTLVDNNGKIEAEDGKKDDRVIAAALAIKLALEMLPKINVYKNIENLILV